MMMGDMSLGTSLVFMVLQCLVTTILGGVIGWLSSQLKSYTTKKKNEDEKIEALCGAMRDMLGDKLDQQYADFQNGEEFDMDRLTKVQSMYENYEKCGGDGIRKTHTEKILGMSLGGHESSED